MYKVTLRFINGNLEGLTITQEWTWRPETGRVVAKPACGGSGYVIECVEEA